VSDSFALVMISIPSGGSLDYSYKLTGDIRGSGYQVYFPVVSDGTNQVRIDLLVNHGGAESGIATASRWIEGFNSPGGDYWDLPGVDPQTEAGDLLILRITNVRDPDARKNAGCRFSFNNTESGTVEVMLPPIVR
jgi:hypothetical protein